MFVHSVASNVQNWLGSNFEGANCYNGRIDTIISVTLRDQIYLVCGQPCLKILQFEAV